MALKKQMCVTHPERSAIGVCMITRQPICAECSTRYEGVNYSKEGLRILQQQRAGGRRGSGFWFKWIGTVLAPLLIFLLYTGYRVTFNSLIDLLQLEL